MPLYTMPNITSGFDDAIVGLASTVPIFIPMVLLFVFCTVFIGGIILQKKRSVSTDIPMWAVIASLSTFMVALPMTLTEGIIQVEVLSIVVAITIFSGFWFFTSRNKNEV